MAMTPEDYKRQTWRQKVKYGLIYKSKVFPFIYFLYSYFLRGGFLDGQAGFYFTVNRLFYFFQIQAKIKLIKMGEMI